MALRLRPFISAEERCSPGSNCWAQFLCGDGPGGGGKHGLVAGDPQQHSSEVICCEQGIDNAADAMNGSGHLRIRTQAADGGVVVEIEDDGGGIPPNAVGQVFDPFFTTKAPGQGTGLGLNIVFNMIRGMGGRIEVESEPGQTVFRVWLPVRRPDGEPGSEPDSESGSEIGSETPSDADNQEGAPRGR